MRNIRISILATVAILVAIGTVMIYSSSGVYAYEKFNDSLFFLKRHLVFLCISVLLALAVLAVDFRLIRKFAKPCFLLSLVLLVLVLVPSVGTEVGGAKRWFKIGVFSFQPSEFAKLALILYMADALARKGAYINDFLYGFLPPLAMSGSVMALVMLQPDLGTSVAMGVVIFILFFVAGVRLSYLAAVFAGAIPIIYASICTVPYRLKRILIFRNPWSDPQGSGFQIIQSFIALSMGGLFGVGLGMSKQKLLYLPASHTDFIFSIIGEELGLLGTGSVTILFLVLVWQGMRVAFRTQDFFARFLSLGISSMIAIEAIINIGVSIGALPTKGLALPFISYGGSALIFHMAGIALLLNAARDK